MKKIFTLCLLSATIFSSCKKDDGKEEVVTPTLRTNLNYATIDTSTYAKNFVDMAGDSTVDRSIGRTYHLMIGGLTAYIKTSVDSTKSLSVTNLINIYTNSNSPFTGTYVAANTSGLQIKSTVAASFASNEADKIRADISLFLENLAASSDSVTKIASNDKSGIISTGSKKYLVDGKGIEWGQIVQKSLIGVYQIDYIGNVLLGNLNADNTHIVAGSKYTSLEQNWDKAYGMLTQKNVYGSAAVEGSASGESLLGAYAWEFNPYHPKTNLALSNLHSTFLKGRAAVVNNDKAYLKIQADAIRLTFEKALASAALGYLGKWKSLSTEAEKAHALAEGIGFIYALRVCKLSGADVAFSDDIFNDLINTGHWNLTIPQVNSAESKIKNKFGL
jgi:hypothetical protein